MTADKRDQTSGTVKMVKNFDLLTTPHSLTPHHSQITADSAPDTNRIKNFLYYTPIGGNVALWGLGGADGSPFGTIYYKTDLTSTTWSQTANNTITHRLVNNVFVEYHDFFYGIQGGSAPGKVWMYDPTGAVAMNQDAATGAISTTTSIADRVANGIVHSKDDVLYLACNNVIASNNNGAWTNAALTLPSKYYIATMCEYGNYLVIGCAPYNGGKSVVYLWDRNSSLTTLSDSIDFGVGQLQIIEQVEGELIGISVRQDVFSNLSTRFVFRRYSGATAKVFRELVASSYTGLQLLYGQKFNANRLYFLAGIEIEGTVHNGIWGVGKNEKGNWVVWFDTLPNNDTAITTSGLAGFTKIGDYACISYCSSPNGQAPSPDANLYGAGYGTGYSLTMTDSTSTAYTGSSIIETVINPDMPQVDIPLKKQLMAIEVTYDPLPSGGQVILKIKADGVGWTTVYTETTAGVTATEAVYDATGTAFTSAREYQFRIESTGGAVVTGLTYKYEVQKTLITI